MESILLDYSGGVAVLRLNRGVTNPINLELLDRLSENLEKAGDDSDVRGIVLASTNDKFFSIGFDIPQLFGLPEKEFAVFYRTFNRVSMELYTFPKPTIAAITGHATAGGCILALCCDYRFIAEGRKLMGLNEIKLGVPVPYPSDCILRDLAGTRYAREILNAGEFYAPDELLRMDLVDRILPLERVLPESIDKAGLIGGMTRGAFRIIKRNRVEAVEAQVEARLAEKEKLFLELWYCDEVRDRLKEAAKKF